MWRRRRQPENTPARAGRTVTRPPRRAWLNEDLALGLLGVTLGLCCAFFPWYVFFNQEKFGIRAVELDSDIPSIVGLSSSTPQIERTVDPKDVTDVTVLELDRAATGATPPVGEPERNPPSLSEQPFPAEGAPFRLVHVANGRAMIEDASGLWVVQRGSVLPDMTRVTAIEQRDGRWVMVTSGDRVIALTQ